ncbi:MAG: hypothetical protein AAF368_17940, partial [Planctomycetota bacterium]
MKTPVMITEQEMGAVQESTPSPVSFTLDPSDWPAFRDLAHRTLDVMLDFQQGAREKPVWRQMEADAERLFKEKAPRRGLGAQA